MKAVRFQFNSNHCNVVSVPLPQPADDSVLIKVQYAALDTAHDAVVNKTFDGGFLHKAKDPLYLGYHYSGVVQKVGDKVSDLPVGSKVFGHLQYDGSQTQGSFAEYITVKASECAIKPDSVSFATAAAATTETLTALQGMRDCGGLTKGKSVLVVGAAGGVGSVAVGIAKRLGAHVTAVCSTKDVDTVKRLGADAVIDRSKQDVMQLKEKFDVIFDTPNALRLPLSMLKPGGAYVITVPNLRFLWGKVITLFSSKKVMFIHVVSKRKDLEQVGHWLSEGLAVAIDSTYDIKDMEQAVERQRGRKNGRVAIRIDGGW